MCTFQRAVRRAETHAEKKAFPCGCDPTRRMMEYPPPDNVTGGIPQECHVRPESHAALSENVSEG